MSTNQQIAQAMRDHHARMVSDLQAHVDLLGNEVAGGHDHRAATEAVLAILEGQVLPHAAAEEQVLYPLASRRGDLATLVDAMIGEHRHLQSAISALRAGATTGETGVRAAGRAEAISTVFRLHAAKENDFVLTRLEADPEVNLSIILAGMHELLEADHAVQPDRHEGEDGVLDVRPLPPARRHHLIFETFESLAPGQSFELVNDHDPKPLRYQLSAEHTDTFSWDYLEAGPTEWRVRIARTGV